MTGIGTRGRPPRAVVAERMERVRGGQQALAFPPDYSKINLLIMETESKLTRDNLLAQKLDFIRAYRLPLPTPMTDLSTVEFNANFSWAGIAAQAFNLGTEPPAVRAGAGIGFTPNQFKTVVLEQPSFKPHTFEWKLGPRNENESYIIQQILHGLRKGMTPDTRVARSLFVFPHIFLLSFSPTPQYLYKFKPCVLRNMEVDYMGGNPVPTFYGDGEGPQVNAKPESIRLRLEFLEIEYWVRDDLSKDEIDGLPSHNPYKFNWYSPPDVTIEN